MVSPLRQDADCVAVAYENEEYEFDVRQSRSKLVVAGFTEHSSSSTAATFTFFAFPGLDKHLCDRTNSDHGNGWNRSVADNSETPFAFRPRIAPSRRQVFSSKGFALLPFRRHAVSKWKKPQRISGDDECVEVIRRLSKFVGNLFSPQTE
jgi:hypothetical protein